MPNDSGAPTSTPPNAAHEPRRLYRRPGHGPLGGVCAGIAEYLNVDPTIVRIAAVVLAITGPGVPAYLLGWIFLPTKRGGSIAATMGPGASRRDRGTQVFGVVLLVIAISVLWGDWWSPAHHWLLPIGLVGAGLWLLTRGGDDDDAPPADPTPSGSSPQQASSLPLPPAAPPPATPSTPVDGSAGDTAASADDTATDDAPGFAAPGHGGVSMGIDGDETTDAFAATGAGDGAPPDPWDVSASSADVPPPPPSAPREPKRRHVLGPIVFGALLVWGGIAWLADIDVDTALAIGLCIVGAGFVLGAFIGGSWALVVPSILLAGALVASTVIDIPLSGGVGQKHWTVHSSSQLAGRYELGIGEATLDLRDLDVARGKLDDVDVQQGIGHMVVIVPEDTTVDIHATVSAGQADLLGRTDDGMNVETDRRVTGSSTHGRIRLDLKLGVGHIEVREAQPSLTLG